MSLLILLGAPKLPFRRRQRMIVITSLALGLMFLLGTAAHARGLLAQLITLTSGETATITCDSDHLHILSQTEQQLEVGCEAHADPTPDPTPEPTSTPEPDPTPDPSADPGDFDSRQIPVEMQAWWMPAFGHIHATAKLPLGQEVSGVLNFDVRIVLHRNASYLKQLRIDDDDGVLIRIPLNLDCPADQTCAFNVPVSLDTTQLQDGWRELRIRAETETPDGKKFLNSSGIPILVNNAQTSLGGSRSDYNRFCNNTSLIGRGWYEGFGYTNAIIECVPLEPVSGVHTFRVRAQKDSQQLTVALDKTHAIPAAGPWPAVSASPGTILFDQNGNFQDFFEVTVDTTQLANGWHSLSVTSKGPNGEVSQCDGCPDVESFPHGVAKMWFYVQN